MRTSSVDGASIGPAAPAQGRRHRAAWLRLARTEAAPLLALAVPVTLSRAGLLLMTTVDTMMTGRAGAEELAYMALGLAPFTLLMLMGTGLLTGTVVLVAQAVGAGESELCRRIWRTALLDALLVGTIAAMLLWRTDLLLTATGQAPDLVAGASEVTRILGLGMPAMLGFLVTTMTLEGLGRPRVGVAVILLGNLVNVGLNLVLIPGAPGLPVAGAAGAALATTLARWIMLGAILAYVWCRVPLPYRTAGGAPRPNTRLQLRLLRLGVPVAVSQGLETSAFQGLILICGWLGTTALAAYQIAINVTALAFMATVGLATATSVRVGQGIGAAAKDRAVAAAWLGLVLTLGVMLVLAPLLGLGGDVVAGVYSADPAVIALAGSGLAIVGVVIVVDGAQGAVTGALRGAGDVWVPVGMHIASFWLVLLPAAWIFAFPLGWGVHGLLAGIVVGLSTATCLLVWRLAGLHRRKLQRA